MSKKKFAALILGAIMTVSGVSSCYDGKDLVETEVVTGFETYCLDSFEESLSIITGAYASPSRTTCADSAQFSGSFSVDSRPETKWRSSFADSGDERSIIYQFAKPQFVAEIRITAENLPGTLTAEGSQDGETFTEIGAFQDGVLNTGGTRALFVKISASDMPELLAGKYGFEINEIEFYTSKSVAVASAEPAEMASIANPCDNTPVYVASGSQLKMTFEREKTIFKIAIDADVLPKQISVYYNRDGQMTLLQKVTGLKTEPGIRIFEFDAVSTDSLRFEFGGVGNIRSITAHEWDTNRDQWAATDGYGRNVATYQDLSYQTRQNKFVGIFYFLWNITGQLGQPYYNLTEISEKNPNVMNDLEGLGELYAWHHIAEPLYGYYNQMDEWVIRRDAQLLSDAGVDVLILDNTNVRANHVGYTYRDQVFRLCEVFSKIREEGGKTPQIMFFMSSSGNSTDTAWNFNFWWENMYGIDKYEDLWFRWDSGKIMTMVRTSSLEGVSEDRKSKFEFRNPDGTPYNSSQKDSLNWTSAYPQGVCYTDYDPYESISASPGQNAAADYTGKYAYRSAYNYIIPFSTGDAMGRDFVRGKMPLTGDALEREIGMSPHFQNQLNRALEVDPRFVFLTGWNECVVQLYNDWWDFPAENMFIDQFNYRYNRDIIPIKDKYGDATYYQMCDFIRKYKGASDSGVMSGLKEGEKIGMNGFDDWLTVQNAYYDDIGDTSHRNYVGFNGKDKIVNETGRNDIITSKVTFDDEYLYFYVKTKEKLTSYRDPAWMRLFIKTEGNGWGNYDYVVNRVSPSSTKCRLEKSVSNQWQWSKVADVDYTVFGRELQIRIPRQAIGLTDSLNFEFKWHDNMQLQGDISEFGVNGDAAPNGRFNYIFRSTAPELGTPGVVLGSDRTRVKPFV